eukprot:2177535-Pleurochrysis_carterae.AAC.2
MPALWRPGVECYRKLSCFCRESISYRPFCAARGLVATGFSHGARPSLSKQDIASCARDNCESLMWR